MGQRTPSVRNTAMILTMLTAASGSAPPSYQLSTYLMRHCPRGVQDRSWLAEIIGTHPRYGLDRQFIRSKKYQVGSTRDGTQTFGPLYVGSVYQYRAIAENNSSGYQYLKGNHLSGYFDIFRGKMRSLSAEDVAEYAEHLETLRRGMRKGLPDAVESGDNRARV